MLDSALIDLIKLVAGVYNIDPALVCAFVETESSGDRYATRFERHTDKYVVSLGKWSKACNITNDTERVHQKTSWGLMQVMGFKARELGYSKSLVYLTNARDGLDIGCRALRTFALLNGVSTHARLEWSEPVVASYNAGSARKDAQGEWVNAEYVRRVKNHFEKYSPTTGTKVGA